MSTEISSVNEGLQNAVPEQASVPAPAPASVPAPVTLPAPVPALVRSYSHVLVPLAERPAEVPAVVPPTSNALNPLPRMQYQLGQEDAWRVYEFVARCTRNFTTLSPEFSMWLQNRMQQFAGQSVVAGALPAPCRLDVLRGVIGKNGYFFKRTTETWKVFFIWHDVLSNTFIFWGPNTKSVVRAMDAIRWRIRKFTLQCPTTPSQFLTQPQWHCWDATGENIISSAQCTNRLVEQQQEQQLEQQEQQLDNFDYSDMPDLI